MHNHADFELIAACQRGDASAFREVFGIYRDRVYALCRNMLGSDEDAEDLTQDIFIAAFKGIRSFSAEAAFGTWLYRIAANRCSAELRKKRPKFQSVDEAEQKIVLPISSRPNPEEQMVRKEMAEARLEMEAFIDDNEQARGELESHLAAWETAQSAQSGGASDGLWEGIEAGLQVDSSESTSLDDLALMIRGLAGEVEDFKREMQGLRREVQSGEWTEEREAASDDIRVRSSVVSEVPRRGNVENVPRRRNVQPFRRFS